MANLLTITTLPHEYFSFVLNGDTANPIKNDRNDLTAIGDIIHFKFANGANLIKEQNIIFSNITIIDGVTTLIPSSVEDLIDKLYGLGFYLWRDNSGVGTDRFDQLADTFSYFGKDGQVLRVNESQQKLETFAMPDVSYLSKFPTPLVAGMMLKVNSTASNYEFVNALNVITQEIRSGYTETTPSEDTIFNALSTIASSITGALEFVDFGRLESDQQDFLIPTGKTAKWAIMNGAIYVLETENNTDQTNTFTQSGISVRTKETLVTENYFGIFIQ